MNCAIYVDADNVSYKSIDEILSKANNCNVIIKKIFADWSHESMRKWAKRARNHGFQGIQCFGNDKKQTSDIHMITDIINDLYTNPHIDMIILATSDIDFTHLCHLIKAKNKKLVIFTPQKSNITKLVNTEEYHSPIKKQKTFQQIQQIKQSVNNKESPKNKVIKVNKPDKNLEYLKEAMKDSQSIYISKYKKNLKKIVPKNIKMDVNHVDKELVKYPKHFKLVKKGNKLKIYGMFHLLNYNVEDFDNNRDELESKYKEIFNVFDYDNIFSSIFD